MNTPDKVIAIAKAEVGYLEKSASAYRSNKNIIYEKTAGAGHDNYTKYGKEMHDIYPAVMDFPAAWCDAFVDWCFYKAYGVATAKSLLAGNFDDYTVASAQMYKVKGALNNTPKIGSQVFFTRNGQVSGCYHTGLVIDFDGELLTVIEGNTSSGNKVIDNGGAVCQKIYNYNRNKSSMIFGHPKYDNVSEPVKVSAPVSKTFAPYAAVVDSSKVRYALTRRTGPGSNYPEVMLLGFKQYLSPGFVVSISEEKNNFGRLTGTNEWVSLEFLKR